MTAKQGLSKSTHTAPEPQELVIDLEFKSLIPPLTDDERRGLTASLIAEGCRDPLIVWKEEKRLLDGHNRLEVCRSHKIPYNVVEVSLPDRRAAEAWIIENQLARRNLNESQRAMLAARLATLKDGQNKKGAQICAASQEEAGEKFNVSRRSVQSAKTVLTSGADELKAAVTCGEVAVSTAAEIATLPQPEQAVVTAKGGAEIRRKAKEIRRGKLNAREVKPSAALESRTWDEMWSSAEVQAAWDSFSRLGENEKWVLGDKILEWRVKALRGKDQLSRCPSIPDTPGIQPLDAIAARCGGVPAEEEVAR